MKQTIVTILFCISLSLSGQLNLLNDEFDNASTITNWQTVNDVEGWNATHLEQNDINTTVAGKLMMMPYTTGWYEDYRSVLQFKTVTGNFVFTTEVTATNRAENGIPGSSYSLAGPMIRAPRNFNNGAAGWTSGGENYVFLSIGQASDTHPSLSNIPTPGPHFEVKTTENSVSNLNVSPITTNENVQIRIARLGSYVICMYKVPNGNWVIHRRFHRPDLPQTLQVGLVAYTNWGKVSTYTPIDLNSNTINSNLSPDPSNSPATPFNPDLIGTFDYARFTDVTIPPLLSTVDLTNEILVTDAMLLTALGFETVAVCDATIIGTPCDDGSNLTYNDVYDNQCLCYGQPVLGLSIENVWLEGFYQNTDMSDGLDLLSLLPASQPFNIAPWNYVGTENGTTVINTNTIADWVLVTVRNMNGNILEEQAALLDVNGRVLNVDGTNGLAFTTLSVTGNYIVSLHTRSHLATATYITQGGVIDFSDISSLVGNNPTKISNGVSLMFAGDYDNNGLINNADFNLWLTNNAAVHQYLHFDVDGNGIVNNEDYNYWFVNRSKVGEPIIQY